MFRLLFSGATVAPEVSTRSSAPTGHELLVASKQQTDGAHAPPPAARKKSAQKTKTEQPTRTAEPTQALAQAKTDTGGETQGGATEKQITFLRMLADRVGAEHAEEDEELWRAADSKRLQVQIKAAVPFKDLAKGEHVHVGTEESVWKISKRDAMISKGCSQRCVCGAWRSTYLTRSGPLGSDEDNTWRFSGHVVDLPRPWSAPMSFSEAAHLYETLPGGEHGCKDVPADWNRL